MSKRNCTIMIIAAALLMLFCLAAQGGQIKSGILQYKLDRLYFPHGQEAYIFERSGFTVYHGDDSVFSGMVEFSGDGVSYSAPIDSLHDSLNIDSLYALIETAEIDSVTPIRVGFTLSGCSGPSGAEAEKTFEELNPPLGCMSKNGNILGIVFFESFLEMTLALESHRVDGFISFNEYRASGGDIVTIAQPFDYFAVVIPNCSRPVNDRGVLSTSLYYRFNPGQSSAYFDGDGVRALNSLFLHAKPSPRIYDYDPDRGRNLLKALNKKPGNISIAVSEASLKPTANYFADILIRDRIKCKVENERDNYDVYLDFVPLAEDDPSVSLKYIVNVLAADTVKGESLNDNLKIIKNYIRQGNEATDADDALDYYHRAERGLIDDFGVFPLYRPTIYVTHYKYIRGLNYDNYTKNLPGMIQRIKLPEGGAE